MARIGLCQRGVLGRQPLIRCRGIALQLAGMGQVLAQLHDAPLRLAQRHTGGLFLTGNLLLRHAVAFEDCPRIGFGFA